VSNLDCAWDHGRRWSGPGHLQQRQGYRGRGDPAGSGRLNGMKGLHVSASGSRFAPKRSAAVPVTLDHCRRDDLIVPGRVQELKFAVAEAHPTP
jgi:hypothetical protein